MGTARITHQWADGESVTILEAGGDLETSAEAINELLEMRSINGRHRLVCGVCGGKAGPDLRVCGCTPATA